MLSLKKLLMTSLIIFAAALVGCEQEGAAEKAGEKIDNAVEEMKDSMDGEGTMEEAGEEIDEAAEEAKESMNQ